MYLESYLDKLDFNSYEKSAIVVLSSTQTATADRVMKQGKIPQGRVYSVLNGLVTKGIVNIIPTSPKEYSIRNLQKTLKRYLESKQMVLNEQISEIDSLVTPTKEFSARFKSPSVHVLSGRDEHLEAIANLHREAKSEVIQIAPLFIGNFAGRVNRRRAANRGVDIRVIIGKITDSNRKNIEESLKSGVKIRQLNSSDLLSVLIADKSVFLLGVQDYHNKEKRLTICSGNKAILSSLSDAFEKHWQEAKEVKLAHLKSHSKKSDNR